jgi:protein-tyrosine phosphatase
VNRDLDIPGLVNARDLGGLTTRDDRTIARHRLVRTESLYYLDEEGQRALDRSLSPRLVLDLRMPEEHVHGGYTLNHGAARVRSVPMQPLAALTPEQVAAGQPTNLIDDYLGQLEANVDALATALDLIAHGGHHPVVVHCTSGKDRTGVVVALVLSLLDVPDDQIADDYALTARVIPVLVDRVRRIRQFAENGLAMAPEWVFAADRETMLAFLEGIRDRYGSTSAWAARAGLPDSTTARLRSSLLE